MSAFIFSERAGQGPSFRVLLFQTVNTVTYFAGLSETTIISKGKKKKKKAARTKPLAKHSRWQ